ncbi:MAG: DUF2490 domain-containing protein [Blastocatellia bacterium]|jgi:hypothetical protein|nr:DUF2490 domain-containing protein [Blastocatellia bacterium]
MQRTSPIIVRRLLVGAIVGSALLTSATAGFAQNGAPVKNEYRGTLVTSIPITRKLILFQYLGIVTNPAKHVITYYYSPPGVIYKPKPWIELWAGMFGLYNNNAAKENSWELRPLAGVKFYVPNDRKLTIFSFTRYEYRSIHRSESGTKESIPRVRTRLGIEAPLVPKERAWTPKTPYVLADVEPIWRLDDGYMETLRLRAGIGYVFNPTWRAELIYHTQWTATKDATLSYTDNIWRLNFKLTLPTLRKKANEPPSQDDDPSQFVDIDE